MAQLVNIFLQPGRVFAQLKDKPTFLIPLLVVTLFNAVLILMYFMKVDSSWYLDHMLLARNSEMSAADLAKSKLMMPSAHTIGYLGVSSAAIATVLVAVLYAFYFMLAGKITGTEVSFRRGMSLLCWSNIPVVLGLIVAIMGVTTMSPQTPLESLLLTNFDPLFVHLPVDSAWSALAKGFNLLNLWVWFLMALGWRTWGKTGWLQAATVAVLPSVAFYGAMAVIALMK